MKTQPYVPLWVKSNFSFLEGASHPEELVARAHALALPALALTDRDGLYGLARAHVAAQASSLKLLAGAEISYADQALTGALSALDASASPPTPPGRLLLLAPTRAAYAELGALITLGRTRAPKGHSQLALADLLTLDAGLIALAPDLAALPLEAAQALADTFGDRLYALVTRHREPDDGPRERHLRARARHLGVPIVVAQEVLYHDRPRRPLQDVLTCLRAHTSLTCAGRRLKPNDEHALAQISEFNSLFSDVPADIARTLEVAARCTFSLAELRYRYPAEALPDGTTSSIAHLAALTYAGARDRYGTPLPPPVIAQLERELHLIEELDYAGYFLTMAEIVRFCHAEQILCQGRGSAANSAVCFCLGITAVDPVRMDFLFERFLSRERAEPPDIDLDIMHERREEVIQFVYRRYGRDRAAMVANVIRYRARSALNDVGRALAIPDPELARLSQTLSTSPYDTLDATALARFADAPPRIIQLITLSSELEGTPRHLSIHPGGFLLGAEPISTLVPVEPAAMAGRTVIQWDKYDVEALGLFKVDLLALGALTQLDHAFKLLQRHRQLSFSMAEIPAADVATFAMCARGDTVGVFQLESRVQMAMLPRLAPKTFYDLVIEISLVRPGPITGDMVHPYLRRRAGEEAVTYPHPALRPILEKTLGIPLFQEQVMRLAVVAAGYTPGEADQLRRDMAAWKQHGTIERHRDKLIAGMEARGIESTFAEKVYQQIRGFGDYGFPESHAASFALIAYATAWLKCHYPVETTCALLNAQPMGFYAPATILEDARRHGVEVRALDVLRSAWDHTLEPLAGPGERFGLRLGLRLVQGLGRKEAEAALDAAASGERRVMPYLRRTRLHARALRALAEAGALDALQHEDGAPVGAARRRELLWAIDGLGAHLGPLALETAEATPTLTTLGLAEVIAWDHRGGGTSSAGHPLTSLRLLFDHQGLSSARMLHTMSPPARVRYAGLVICRQRPVTASGVVFMTLEDETGFVNLVIWPNLAHEFGVLIQTAALLGVTGTLQVQEGAGGRVTHLIAETLWRPELPPTEAPAFLPRSRDFH